MVAWGSGIGGVGNEQRHLNPTTRAALRRSSTARDAYRDPRLGIRMPPNQRLSELLATTTVDAAVEAKISASIT